MPSASANIGIPFRSWRRGVQENANRVVFRDRQRDAGLDSGQLLDADAVLDGGHAGAAVRVGKLDAEQSKPGELGDELGWKVLRLIPLHDVRTHLALGEFADAAAQNLLFFGESKVHGAISGSRRTGAG